MAAVHISALREDEDEAGTEAVGDTLAYLRTHDNPMRQVGRRVLRTGKRCMDHFQNVLEEEAHADKIGIQDGGANLPLSRP